jgi:multidrug efflux system membrane fusion protein
MRVCLAGGCSAPLAVVALAERMNTAAKPPGNGSENADDIYSPTGSYPLSSTSTIGPDHQLPSPAPVSRHPLLKVAVWICILVIFGLGFWWVMRKQNAAADTNTSLRRGGGGPVTITEATAANGDIGLYVEGIGTVTPVHTNSITSQVSGPIKKIYFEEGQLVGQGDPLIDIDPRPFQATLLQAQGALERDQNLLAQGKMDVDRYRTAWGKNAIPKQTLDDQEKLVLQQAGTVKNDQGLVDFDQVQVDYCHITSPITGRIGLRLVDPGNVVQANGTVALAVVAQISPITVVFTMPEDDIGLVVDHLQGPAKLAVDAYDRAGQTKIATGELLALDNQIDTTTGTVKARAVFPNTDGKLFPNQFVNVRLLVTTYHNVTRIPSSAIQHNGTLSFVYVIDDDTAKMQNITPGITEAGLTQVSGIAAGDVVANSGFEKLQDKAKVVVAKDTTKDTTGDSGTGSATEPTTGPTTGPTSGPTTRPRRHRTEAP